MLRATNAETSRGTALFRLQRLSTSVNEDLAKGGARNADAVDPGALALQMGRNDVKVSTMNIVDANGGVLRRH